MPNPRNLLRRRPLLALLILILLLIIGYTARALDHSNKSSAPGPRSGYPTVTVMPTQFTGAQDGGRLALNAAIPS